MTDLLLNRALRAFFKEESIKTEPTKAGIANQSWVVKTVNAKYILRLYAEDTSYKQISAEIAALRLFTKNGIPGPQLVKTLDGSRILAITTRLKTCRYFVVFEFLEGKHLSAKQMDLLPQVAQTQAKLHLIARKHLKPRESLDSFYRGCSNYLVNELKRSEAAFRKTKVWDSLIAIQQNISCYQQKHNKELLRLPSAESHGDYDSNNILAKDGRLTAVLDYGELRNLPFIADIGNTLYWYIANNKTTSRRRIVKMYLFNYARVRQFKNRELKQLTFFMRVRNIMLLAFLYGNDFNCARADVKKCLRVEKWLLKNHF